MTASEYRSTMGALFERLGRQALEGRFAALLLGRSEAVTLAEAAKTLGVTRSALSKLANEMLERGDLKRSGVLSTREHAYDLVDNAYIRDLLERREVSRLISEASSAHAGDASLTDAKAVMRLHYHAGVHAQAAMSLEHVLKPEEKLQADDLKAHVEENWDAVPAGETRRRRPKPG